MLLGSGPVSFGNLEHLACWRLIWWFYLPSSNQFIGSMNFFLSLASMMFTLTPSQEISWPWAKFSWKMVHGQVINFHSFGQKFVGILSQGLKRREKSLHPINMYENILPCNEFVCVWALDKWSSGGCALHYSGWIVALRISQWAKRRAQEPWERLIRWRTINHKNILLCRHNKWCLMIKNDCRFTFRRYTIFYPSKHANLILLRSNRSPFYPSEGLPFWWINGIRHIFSQKYPIVLASFIVTFFVINGVFPEESLDSLITKSISLQSIHFLILRLSDDECEKGSVMWQLIRNRWNMACHRELKSIQIHVYNNHVTRSCQTALIDQASSEIFTMVQSDDHQ